MTICKGCEWEKYIPRTYKIGELGSFVVNHAIEPKVFGHIVVMLRDKNKEHPKDITELKGEVYKECFDIAGKIARMLREVVEKISGTKVERVYLVAFNESTDEWHPHVHVIPRTINESKRGEKIFDLQSPYIPKKDLEDLVNELKEKLGITQRAES